MTAPPVAASARGLSVLVEQTGGEFVRENDVLLGRRPTIVDGLIFSPISVTQAALDEASPAVPLVLLGEHLMASQRSRVAADNVAALDAPLDAKLEAQLDELTAEWRRGDAPR